MKVWNILINRKHNSALLRTTLWIRITESSMIRLMSVLNDRAEFIKADEDKIYLYYKKEK